MNIAKQITRQVAVLLIAAVTAFSASARTPVPIANQANVPIVSAQPLSSAQVKAAITAAATSKRWTVSQTGPDKLTAQLFVNGKHTVYVDITYAPTSYSVAYKDSINMNYRVNHEGVPVIHPFYNNWVRELMTAVTAELGRS